jgi:hypothetical protein
MTVTIRLSAKTSLKRRLRTEVPQPVQNLASGGMLKPQVAQFMDVDVVDVFMLSSNCQHDQKTSIAVQLRADHAGYRHARVQEQF